MSDANEGKKVKYITVGTIKTIDLSNHTFTIEPIAAYRFQMKDDDDKSWKIIFKEEKEDPKELKLIKRDVKFVFDKELTSGLIMLKQNKTKMGVKIESVTISELDISATGTSDPKVKGAINDSVSVEVEIQ